MIKILHISPHMLIVITGKYTFFIIFTMKTFDVSQILSKSPVPVFKL